MPANYQWNPLFISNSCDYGFFTFFPILHLFPEKAEITRNSAKGNIQNWQIFAF